MQAGRRAQSGETERVRYFPLGLTATEKLCEIGGNLSANAGGIGVLRYGNARDLVLGVEVVLPDGRIWHSLRSLRKDNTGYNLKHLFIGAEGTLGIITTVMLKLLPRPQAAATACVAHAGPEVGVQLLVHIRAVMGDTLSSFELFSRSCLDLVLTHIPDTREPLARRLAWYLLIRVEDVMRGVVGVISAMPYIMLWLTTKLLPPWADGQKVPA